MPRVRRIVGVDTARGLAVLGMVTAHVGPGDPWRTFPPGGWSQLADGRPSALFVLLAGVGLALLSGGDRPVDGTRLVQARLRILVRAVLLVVLGTLLVLLGTPVVVILVVYAGLFAAGVAVLRWPRWALVVAAVVVALLGPVLRRELVAHVDVVDERPLDLLAVLVGQYYPAVVWFAYVLVGLAVGRSDLRSGRTHAVLAAWGAGLVVVGHGGAWAARLLLGRVDELTTAEPHSSTFFEVAGNTGTCLLVLAVCLAVGVRWPRALAPVSATGALALTAYTGQLLVIAALGDTVVWQPTTAGWVAFLLVTVATCWLWHATLGRGPLEGLLHVVSVRAADVAPDTLPPRRDPAAPAAAPVEAPET
ncbi:heparan-alpha-glucosaminide N-acetyltransferase domain-containing protein [Cellulomonas wangsupingiae]|uniref:heparan-alpha-glucosaminide N-acetyltransferase domain-containing protein n=1 Tax=Cellulomonas wangsupingiae TaxID=2968085 RepID=UPI001D0F0D10|nr:heparan-alpha-glucosaminide N-acetyltransferase domain-containing protein [Cellulomonas wangsupingiae]MCM0638516.1 heparan-alpha-glucosaminide N-acetyltransferase domain-containing protein [Cellulomonas wangsupingiae]